MPETPSIRIGAVTYLNTKPLVYQLESLAPQATIVYDFPSRLADQLRQGLLDVALIPTSELFQNSDYTVLSDACIGCRGPVLSVKLYFRVPVREVQTLSADAGSRTSVVLSQVLLQQRAGIRPALTSLPIGQSAADSDADAILMIGDRAMHASESQFTDVWDLGDHWYRWAELPFVFAMWTARSGTDLTDIEIALSQARDRGVKNLQLIAQREAQSVGLSESQTLSYLENNLHFYLGAQERRAVQVFHDHSARLNLAPQNWKMHLNDCQTAR